MLLTQREVDFLKSSLNKNLNQLEEAKETVKALAQDYKKLGNKEDSAQAYKDVKDIENYRAKFAEIQRKLKRGIVTMESMLEPIRLVSNF